MLARGSGASSSVGEEGVGMGIGVGAEPYYSVPVGSTGGPPQHWSQPTSPTPTHSSRQPPNLYQHVHKDDDSEYISSVNEFTFFQKHQDIVQLFINNSIFLYSWQQFFYYFGN